MMDYSYLYGRIYPSVLLITGELSFSLSIYVCVYKCVYMCILDIYLQRAFLVRGRAVQTSKNGLKSLQPSGLMWGG